MTDPAALAASFAYLIPAEKFIFKLGGQWQLNTPVGREGIAHYLSSVGVDRETAKTLLGERQYLHVVGTDNRAGHPEIWRDAEGNAWVNTWVPPALEPATAPGPWPRIETILDWLVGHDAAALEWVVHWLAYKVQNPEVVPKIAVVFCTVPGAGKGTLFRVIQHMLGERNTATLERGALESRFNARWADKLFVLADEVMTSDNHRDVSERLKILIDSPYIELEGKGQNQREVRNRLAWIFATNDKVTPIKVDESDRRYSVFANFDLLTDEYKALVQGCYDKLKNPTPEFLEEIRHFWSDLLALDVDLGLLARPFENEARAELIGANKPSHELFFQEVVESGIDQWVNAAKNDDMAGVFRHAYEWELVNPVTREKDIVATRALYRCYEVFCRQAGRKPLALNKFGVALKNHRPAWEPHRVYVRELGRQVRGYQVKRTSAPQSLKAVG